jgi:outer membrane biosynthesis protein TonB
MTTATLPNHVSFTHNASFQNFYDLFKPSEQDKKFTTILVILFAFYFVIAVIVPFLEQVEIPRAVKEQVPVQLARIILKEKQLPLPEKSKEKIVKEKPIEVKPEDIKKEKVKDQPIKPPEALSIEKRRDLAKQKAQTSGLAAMKDELFAMREAFDVVPATKITLDNTKSTETKIKRKLLAGDVNKQSATLSAVKTSQVVNSDKLSTHNTQHIRLSEEEVLAGTDVLVDEDLAASNAGQRSEMSLRRTLEAHKSRLYARYNRALRKDPFLQGKVLFEIEIQPNGKVSSVDIKSSELNNAKLERQLLMILRSITFPAEAVSVMVTIWAIDFLPN